MFRIMMVHVDFGAKDTVAADEDMARATFERATTTPGMLYASYQSLLELAADPINQWALFAEQAAAVAAFEAKPKEHTYSYKDKTVTFPETDELLKRPMSLANKHFGFKLDGTWVKVGETDKGNLYEWAINWGKAQTTYDYTFAVGELALFMGVAYRLKQGCGHDQGWRPTDASGWEPVTLVGRICDAFENPSNVRYVVDGGGEAADGDHFSGSAVEAYDNISDALKHANRRAVFACELYLGKGPLPGMDDYLIRAKIKPLGHTRDVVAANRGMAQDA